MDLRLIYYHYMLEGACLINTLAAGSSGAGMVLRLPLDLTPFGQLDVNLVDEEASLFDNNSIFVFYIFFLAN